MRVIAGSAKGRELKGPKAGKGTIRPTSDKVREALFDILMGHIEGARVLDLYAGTGALGIEALSRGAASAELVEADREAQALIAENLQRTGLNGRLCRGKVEKVLDQLAGDYHLILADPPYADLTITSLLPRLAERLCEGGLIVLEHASRVPLPEDVTGLRLWKRRRHGDTTLSMYERL